MFAPAVQTAGDVPLHGRRLRRDRGARAFPVRRERDQSSRSPHRADASPLGRHVRNVRRSGSINAAGDVAFLRESGRTRGRPTSSCGRRWRRHEGRRVGDAAPLASHLTSSSVGGLRVRDGTPIPVAPLRTSTATPATSCSARSTARGRRGNRAPQRGGVAIVARARTSRHARGRDVPRHFGGSAASLNEEGPADRVPLRGRPRLSASDHHLAGGSTSGSRASGARPRCFSSIR
jgi:hypothetical protein